VISHLARPMYRPEDIKSIKRNVLLLTLS
jgi:hypothetical protein